MPLPNERHCSHQYSYRMIALIRSEKMVSLSPVEKFWCLFKLFKHPKFWTF